MNVLKSLKYEIVNKTEVNLDGFTSKMVVNGNGNVINIPRIVNN